MAQHTSFLSLPPEIRNRIYEQVLLHNPVLCAQYCPPNSSERSKLEIFLSESGNNPPHKISSRKKRIQQPQLYRFLFPNSEPALLRTCRRIREDALPVFYGGNVFGDTYSDQGCIKFLTWIGPEKRKMLKQLRIRYWGHYVEHTLRLNGTLSSIDQHEQMMVYLRSIGLEIDAGALKIIRPSL